MKVFNIGIIGFGGFGKFLFNAWNQLDNVQATAIADINAAAITGIENITFFEADEMITGRFKLGRSKQEVYADCVKSSLLDVLQKVSDSSHTLMASLESGLSSLEIAELATISAKSNS